MLDLGCGAGLPTARQLTTGGLDVVGVDTSARMLDLARRNVPAAGYRRADLRAVPDEIGAVDAVAAFFSLLMLPRAEFVPTLAALRSRLRGRRLLALGMVEGDLDDAPIDFLGVPVRVSALPADEMAGAVTAAGYRVLSVRRETVEVGDTTETQLFLYAEAATPDDR